jgi:dephospho-CoA kinase
MKKRRHPGGDGLYVVGVTGGVASGKTTLVEAIAAAGGAVVIDADRLGHAILARPAVTRALAEAFGADILDPASGRVRRDVLGPRAFATPEALASLNAIVHPPLLVELDRILAAHGAAAATAARLVVLDAALLVEWDAGERCDEVIAVIARPEAQVARLVRERGRGEDEARAIVARQLPAEARAAYADRVIENDGTREEFVHRAHGMAAEVRGRAAAIVRGGRG